MAGGGALQVEEQAGARTMEREKTFGGTGMRIIFKELDYHVPSNRNKGERAYLLKQVSGWFEPQQMAALMGPSGSGKTTLLDLLAGRKSAGVIEGLVTFGGQKATPMFLRRYTGYVEQFDTLIGILTVHEMLMYTAELKRSRFETLESKQAAVEAVLDKLGLQRCRDVKIGSTLARGISGGQAKRVNIGIALITNPRVLFLDEPTSGLDSYTSNEVMAVVKSLVKDGVTICATIHSPTSYCFSLFDSLSLLVKGRMVYFGRQGRTAIDFARASCPNVKEYLPGYNDAEYLIDFVTEADMTGHSDELADHYDKSELARTNMARIDEMVAEGSDDLPEHIKKELQVKSATVTPWWWGLKTIIKYRTSKNYRAGEFLGPRIGDKLMISLLIMTLFLGIGNDFKDDNIINMAAVQFMWVTLPAFGAAAYVPILVLDRALFVRERNDGLYRTFTYLLSKMFDELAIALVASILISLYSFYGIALQGEWVLFWLVYYCTLANGVILAYFVATVAPSLDVANSMLPTYVATLLYFGGFLLRFDEMPPWWKWYSYVNFIRYSWGALMVNQFTEKDPIFIEGETVLEYYGLEEVDKWSYVGFTALFFLFFFTVTLVTMTYRKFNNR